MKAEFYSVADLERSRTLYQSISAWGRPRRDANLIGGWAVHELVTGFAMESRDVDLILHSPAALDSFARRMPEWKLVWRKTGRTVYKECHLESDSRFPPLVDVFTTDPSIGANLFTTLAGSNVKPSMGRTWLPPVRALVRDKILTIPLRTNVDKFAKDLLDLWTLVFHNREEILPSDLAKNTTPKDRTHALDRLLESARAYPQFQRRFDEVGRWLRQT